MSTESGFKALWQLIAKTLKEVTSAKAPSVLYHYTSAEGLKGIVDSRVYWASHIQFLNDRSEFQLVFDIATRVILGNGAFKSFSNDFRRILVEHIAIIGAEGSPGIYVASLSENGDLLSQWRAYCPTGGYSIGFDSAQLEGLAGTENFSLGRCVYGEQESESLIQRFLQSLEPGAEQMQQKGGTSESIAKTISLGLLELAPFMKHSAFSEEKEWRLILVCGGNIPEKPQFRPLGSVLMPYAMVPLGNKKDNPFVEIRIGPNDRGRVAYIAIKKFLLSEVVGDVDVIESEAPYRPM